MLEQIFGNVGNFGNSNIEEFLTKISSLSDTALSVVMASGANPHNPYKSFDCIA